MREADASPGRGVGPGIGRRLGDNGAVAIPRIPMISKKQFATLQASRQRGLSRLLLLARRVFLERVAEAMAASGLQPMPDACVMILPYIDLEGTRSTVIAQRASTTRQAVGQVVATLEAMGLVEKRPDEADKRAAVVSFTDAGVRYLIKMHDVIDRVENEFAQASGEGDMEIVRRTLARIAYGA